MAAARSSPAVTDGAGLDVDLDLVWAQPLWFNTAMAVRPAAPPPLVTVLAILLYVGGGQVIVSALIGSGTAGAVVGVLPAWGQALYGALYVGLARALQLGLRWAWRVAVALCWVGLVLAALCLLARDPQGAVAQGTWPAVFLVMLTRTSVREWFAPKPAAPGEMQTGEQ